MDGISLAKLLVANGNTLFNVSEKKQPVDANGRGLDEWQLKTHAELVAGINWKIPRFGMMMGQQGNGRLILSLDFDICGKKRKNPQEGESLRVGCDITKGYWEEWNKVSDTGCGMYNGGTEGNFNMLVDYTDSDKIKAKVEQMKLIKATAMGHGGMEVFYGTHNQVIPPSATIDKTTGKIGKARQFVSNEYPFRFIHQKPTEEEWLEGFLDRIIKHNASPNCNTI